MPVAIEQLIVDFVTESVRKNLTHSLDTTYTINRLAVILQVKGLITGLSAREERPSLLELLEQLVDYGQVSGLIEDSSTQRQQLENDIMDQVTPKPSTINKKFWVNYKTAPIKATDEFYRLSRKANIVRTKDIEKNIVFSGPSPYGDLEITINLSKPEKSSKDIALEKMATAQEYPICRLCIENEGYEGRVDWPARANHRLVRLALLNGLWYYHYSPYAYFNEHAIFLSEKHEPMVVNQNAVNRLLEIVTIFPHYFVGSNAGLPIVGGSILGHNHYQGGRYVFPMNKAKTFAQGSMKDFSSVKADLLHWPVSVVRLRGQDRNQVEMAALSIMDLWKDYSEESSHIFAFSGGQEHNAVTLIASRNGSEYELHLALRNNRTTEEFPEGIFHPHQDVQHIKKENIGLIEVMGLAILPPRLKEEIAFVKAFLLDEIGLDEVSPIHQYWAQELKLQHTFTEENNQELIEQAIVKKFQRVLEDAGVFKQTPSGRQAFLDFAAQFMNISKTS